MVAPEFIVSAPAKVLLLGEYAVTAGATALIAAVDRRAHGRWTSPAPAPSPVVAAVLEEARARGFSRPSGGPRIDSAAFQDARGAKLGLGSSAAVAVVTAALVTQRVDEVSLELALLGHRAAAGGRGSGVDVAACFQGGVIAAGRQPGPIEPLPARCGQLVLGLIYVGESASTVSLLEACQKSPRWAHWLSVLTPLAAEGVEAWRNHEESRFLEAVAAYGRAMDALGREAGVPIVTETMQRVLEAAEAAGGAAKPSGAGGGDVMLVVSRDPELAPRLARDTGTHWVEASIDPAGLRVDA